MRHTCAFLTLSCFLAPGFTPWAQPPRYATRVVEIIPGGGSPFGVPETMLRGPQGSPGGGLDVWSLGEGGSAVLGFDVLIADMPGPDFIVFENAFVAAGPPGRVFGELLYVEVSSNGSDFARFPVRSSIPGPVPSFATIPRGAVEGLAGSDLTYANVLLNPIAPFPFRPGAPTGGGPHRAGGTAFDLADLASHSLVLNGNIDLQAIHFVRLVDVVGDGSELDRDGHPIYDPYPDSSADVDAVAVVNFRLPEEVPWSQPFGNAQASARRFFPGTVRNPSEPAWQTDPEGLRVVAGPVLLPLPEETLVVAWGQEEDSAIVKAFDAETGTRAWTSPLLDTGFSIAFDSWSTPCADEATSSVYFATGRTVYRLAGEDGRILWDTPLEASGSQDIVNGSIHIAEGLAVVPTFGGFAADQKRLYALRLTDGSVAWSIPDSGPGSDAPVLFRDGAMATLNSQGISAYALASGDLLWSHAAPLSGEAWTSTRPLFGGLTARDGVLLTTGYNFATGGGSLLCVEASTGRLLWEATGTLNGNGVPLLHEDRVLIQGHDLFGGPSFLAAHDVSTGEELWRIQVAEGTTVLNQSLIATDDVLYLTEGPGGGGLRLHNPASGDLLAGPLPGYTGTPALGADGSLYLLTADGGLARFSPETPSTGGGSTWVVY